MVLVRGNLAGEKLPLLIIGHAKKPRCFPNDQSQLPVMHKTISIVCSH